MRSLVLAALCACNPAFGLDGTKLEPDAPTLDSDGDGVPDVSDNCAAIANATQADEDRDGVGNACDNCPIVANTDQQDIGETVTGSVPDGIGDRCDPHPADRDCLIAFDSFDEPERFAAHWGVGLQGVPGTAMPIAGAVVLSAPSSRLSIELRDDGGAPVLGKHEVQVVAQFPESAGSLVVASNVTNARTGLWCGITATAIYFTLAPDSGAVLSAQEGILFPPPLADDAYFRILTTLPDGSPVIACSAEYGITLRDYNARLDVAATGSPAVMVAQATATVTGFTAYRNASTTSSCPTPLIR